jgi:hypothetical protein
MAHNCGLENYYCKIYEFNFQPDGGLCEQFYTESKIKGDNKNYLMPYGSHLTLKSSTFLHRQHI